MGNFSSAAVVIGALRVKIAVCTNTIFLIQILPGPKTTMLP